MPNRRVAKGKMIEMITEEVMLPNGRQTTLDIIHHPGASAIVPFVAEDEVLLIRQYRHATGGELLEIPAGKLDPGEAPRECALRELEEETGFRAGRCEYLSTFWTTPGFTDERIHLFAAWELEKSSQNLDEDEIIALVRVPLSEALEMVFRGELDDGKSALGLLQAARRFGRLESERKPSAALQPSDP